MTVAEFSRRLEKIDLGTLQVLGIVSVQENQRDVIGDSINANLSGQTFDGNSISRVKPFSDWEETGEFHDNLKFADLDDIEFFSLGDGYSAIRAAFDEKEWIAPDARTLSVSTLEKLRQSLIKNLQAKLWANL